MFVCSFGLAPNVWRPVSSVFLTTAAIKIANLGSNISEHEAESEQIRPMARSLTRHLDKMRNLLKDQALRDPNHYSPKIKSCLRVFDSLFADFEFQ